MVNPAPTISVLPNSLLEQLSLWSHQLEAIECMRRYIADYQNGQANGSALVHMPTGSGKTGVIAALSRCVPEVGCTLILSPRIALREQLVRDIQSRFFDCLENKPSVHDIPKTVIEITGDAPVPEVTNPESAVLIATIQKIHSAVENDSGWKKLAKHISLVIVDEGHYEPAAAWSVLLRSFRVPKIVFTATLSVIDSDLSRLNASAGTSTLFPLPMMTTERFTSHQSKSRH